VNRLKDDPDDVRAAVDLAAFCADNNRITEIPEILGRFERQFQDLDAATRTVGCELLALGYADSQKYPDAERILEMATADGISTTPLCYAKVQSKQALREYPQVVEAAEAYFGCIKSKGSPSNMPGVSPEHRARVYDWLGYAYGELQQFDEAIDAFEKAIELEPPGHRPYLNLVRILGHLGRKDEAFRVVDRGIEDCARTDELEMLRISMAARPSISACMIVKNEEDLLPDCLDSIRDWVTEIIVVDTGSTDRTVAIAKEYGARIFHQEWENDFSKHRNFSIEQATGDWVFIIDADERFVAEDVPHVIDSMITGEQALLSMSVYNVYGPDKTRTTFANSVRFFKRELGLRYDGIVHNVLQVPEDQPVLRISARLKHLGYDLPPERMKQKFERTKALLKRQLDDDPDDVFALFNYAELHRGVEPKISDENAAVVIHAANRVLDLIDEDDLRRRHLVLMSLNQLAAIHISLGDLERGRECCEHALELKPDYLDALIHLGFACYGLREYRAAAEAFERYLDAQQEFDGAGETSPIILTYPNARDLARTNLGILEELLGKPERAKQD
jgi:glycosyltransferase involved in cell wall biosynthesis